MRARLLLTRLRTLKQPHCRSCSCDALAAKFIEVPVGHLASCQLTRLLSFGLQRLVCLQEQTWQGLVVLKPQCGDGGASCTQHQQPLSHPPAQ